MPNLKRNDLTDNTILLIFSFALSLLFLKGKIDQDFFSFLYVGKGVANGLGMFKDFSDNKGPVLYFLFSLLYLVFRNNYLASLIFTSTLLDAFSAFFLLKLIESWLGYKSPRQPLARIALLSIFVLAFKSFSIGNFMGGVYAETLAITLFLFSAWLFEKGKNFPSGVVFGLSVLTRPTHLIFLTLIFARLLFFDNKNRKIKPFILGSTLAVLFVASIFSARGELGYLYEDMVLHNLVYTTTVAKLHFFSIISNIFTETRMLVGILCSVVAMLVCIFSRNSKNEKLFILVFFLASYVASFAGGIFYFHHFVSFVPFMVSSAILLISKYNFLGYALMTYYLILTMLSFGSFYSRGTKLNANIIDERLDSLVNTKKYVQVVPYYPQLYFVLDRNSPDSYYQVFQISNFYRSDNQLGVGRHLNLGKDRLEDTLFLTIESNEFDRKLIDEYKGSFFEKFKLGEVYNYKVRNFNISAYQTIK